MVERKEILISDIIIDTTQARRGEWTDDKKDKELINSINGMGIIHDPIVRITNSEKYSGETDKPYALVVGSRRLNSKRALGHKTVECIIVDITDVEAISMSFNENIGRKRLTQYQKMIAIDTWYKLLMENGYSKEEAVKEIANKSFGGSTPSVYQYLRIADIEDIHFLIKTPDERTEFEKGQIIDAGINEESFRLGNIEMDVIESIFKSESFDLYKSDSTKSSSILRLIKNAKIDEKKGVQKYETLSDLRKMFESGQEYEVIIKELEKDAGKSLMKKLGKMGFTLPQKYIDWHKRALTRSRNKKGGTLVKEVYIEWLIAQSKAEGW